MLLSPLAYFQFSLFYFYLLPVVPASFSLTELVYHVVMLLLPLAYFRFPLFYSYLLSVVPASFSLTNLVYLSPEQTVLLPSMSVL